MVQDIQRLVQLLADNHGIAIPDRKRWRIGVSLETLLWGTVGHLDVVEIYVLVYDVLVLILFKPVSLSDAFFPRDIRSRPLALMQGVVPLKCLSQALVLLSFKLLIFPLRIHICDAFQTQAAKITKCLQFKRWWPSAWQIGI